MSFPTENTFGQFIPAGWEPQEIQQVNAQAQQQLDALSAYSDSPLPTPTINMQVHEFSSPNVLSHNRPHEGVERTHSSTSSARDSAAPYSKHFRPVIEVDTGARVAAGSGGRKMYATSGLRTTRSVAKSEHVRFAPVIPSTPVAGPSAPPTPTLRTVPLAASLQSTRYVSILTHPRPSSKYSCSAYRTEKSNSLNPNLPARLYNTLKRFRRNRHRDAVHCRNI